MLQFCNIYFLKISFHLQIVLTNEFTTKLKNDEYSIGAALGESHSHKISQRIILGRHPLQNGRFIAHSEKGFVCSSSFTIEFEVRIVFFVVINQLF